MKIEWLDTDRRRAKIARGLLWWKRVTYVRQAGATWVFEASGNGCPYSLRTKIDESQRDTWERDRLLGSDSEWYRPAALPKAKVLP